MARIGMMRGSDEEEAAVIVEVSLSQTWDLNICRGGVNCRESAWLLSQGQKNLSIATHQMSLHQAPDAGDGQSMSLEAGGIHSRH